MPFSDNKYTTSGGIFARKIAPPDRLESTTTSVFDCSGLLIANPA
jgi:hypothetical protein